MIVNRTATDEIEVTLTSHQAGLLATILSGVADNTEGGSMERLYDLLLDRAVFHEGTAKVVENTMYDEEDPFDPFTHNIMLED